MTDIPLFKATYAPLLRHTVQVPTPDARLAEPGESAEAFALRCADALEAHLAEHAATTAALIVEPLVQGAAGMAMYHPAYLTRARELCDQYQVHLIADEIAVGFGRTGTMFAFEQATALTSPHASHLALRAVRPDFICLSKGITGGYLPLSAVLTTDDVYAAFYGDATARGFLHSHSYTGNPLACRAALAVLDIFEDDAVIAANRLKSAEFTGHLAEVAAHPRVRHFRHLRDDLGIRCGRCHPRFCRPLPPGGAGTGRVHPSDRQHRVRHAALRDVRGRDARAGGRHPGLPRRSCHLTPAMPDLTPSGDTDKIVISNYLTGVEACLKNPHAGGSVPTSDARKSSA